jgi:hypothetical protein
MKPPATSQFTPPRATHGATGSPAPMKAPPPPGALGSAPLPPQSPPTQQFGESPNWVKNRPGFPGGAPDHAGHQNPGEGGRVNAAGPANNDSLRKVGKVDLPAAGSGKADPNRVVNEGETASHTTPFAWCTPFLKDFSRRHSSPALPFQRLTGKTFD